MRARAAFRRATAWALLLLALEGGCGGGGADPQPAAPTLLDALRAAPGVVSASASQGQRADGGRVYVLRFAQPVDHRAPAGPGLLQTATLLVYGPPEAPLVFSTAGYAISTRPERSEPSAILGANELIVEHRFFGSSAPASLDWTKLDVWQAASDHHRIAAALRPILTGRWISTGGSKGGMAALFHRRFYPDDVDGTVAYVAPIMRSDRDDRFAPFLEAVGDASCRASLAALQRALLARRAELEPLLAADARAAGETLDVFGVAGSWEIVVIEAEFGFWQAGGAARCGSIPAPDAPAAELYGFLRDLAGGSYLPYLADRALAARAPFYYQCATQLGWPAYPQDHLADLLAAPIEDVPARFPPDAVAKVFDPAPMSDVAGWLATRGERIMLVYGEYDPWTAAMAEVAPALDAHRWVVAGAAHDAALERLPGPDRAAATAVLRRWAGLPPAAAAPGEVPAVAAFARDALLRGEPGFAGRSAAKVQAGRALDGAGASR